MLIFIIIYKIKCKIISIEIQRQLLRKMPLIRWSWVSLPQSAITCRSLTNKRMRHNIQRSFTSYNRRGTFRLKEGVAWRCMPRILWDFLDLVPIILKVIPVTQRCSMWEQVNHVWVHIAETTVRGARQISSGKASVLTAWIPHIWCKNKLKIIPVSTTILIKTGNRHSRATTTLTSSRSKARTSHL